MKIAKMGVKIRRASKFEWLILASLLAIVAALLFAMTINSKTRFLGFDVTIFSDGNTVPLSQICPPGLLNSNPENGIAVYSMGRGSTESNGTSTYIEFQFLLVNLSNREIRYWGYRPDSYTQRLPRGVVQPLYSMAIAQFDKWEPADVRWCGTGTANMRLKAGQAGRFKAYLNVEERLARIGVRCFEEGAGGVNKEFVVWSEPFGIDQERPPRSF